ncbi:hypothetical protein HZ326_25614 [Fusarium oxysporum f. sp. albedinis]|nr:hypothetical protein HZ326_25614 [Fusarium oxysporum f. sp. albedinis]
MAWPPYLPDLNPIENLWALMKAEIYWLHPELTYAEDTVATQHALVKNASLKRHLQKSLIRLDEILLSRGMRILFAPHCKN